MKFVILVIVLLIFSVNRNAFISSDEAVNLQMVKNMQMDPERFMLRPSYDPGGHASWEKESMSHILMTPFFHYLLLGFNKILPGDLLLSSSIFQSILLLIFFYFFFIKRKIFSGNNQDGHEIEFFMLSIFPVAYFLHLEHEGPMVLFGFCSILLAAEGLKNDRKLMFILSGFFLGLGFLSKLWLVGPFGIGLIFMLIHSIYKKEYSAQKYIISSFLLLLAFLSTSASHLISIYIVSPQDLNIWVDNVYLGIITGGGDYGTKESSSAGWTQPIYYYVYTIVRDLLSVFPLITLGVLNLWRFRGENRLSNLSIGLFGIFSGFVPLSFSGTKEPLYILPCYFALIILSIQFYHLKINRNEILKIFILNSFLYGCFLYLAFFTNASKTLNSKFILSSLGANSLVYILIFFRHILNKKIPIIISVIIFSIAPGYNYLNIEKRFKPVISFIKKDNAGKDIKANMTYIVSDYYSHVGYFAWNRVLKYSWIAGNNQPSLADIEKIISTPQYKYFIISKERLDRSLIIDAGKKMGLFYKKFDEIDLLYKK